jgi:hypothetical protein
MPNQIFSSADLSKLIDSELSKGGIDASIPGTFTNSLVQPFKVAISTSNGNIINLYNRSILELATAKDLEEKVLEFGISRNTDVSNIQETSDNFYVYIKTGIASDYTLDITSPLVIPKENIRAADVNGNSYIINDDIILQPNSNTAFASIFSVNNINIAIPQGTITTLEYIIDDNIINLNPAKANDLILGASNSKAIGAQTVSLSDSELRRKAYLRINSMNNNNEDAIRLALEQYNISDITFRYDHFGFGTLGILIRIGGSTALSRSSLDKLNNVVTNIVPFARVIVPEELVVKLQIDVKFNDGSKVSASKDNILVMIQNYFLDLNIGNYMDPADIISLIQTDENVLKSSIRCIFIDNRKAIIRRQYALSDQIFVLDQVTPIEYTS